VFLILLNEIYFEKGDSHPVLLGTSPFPSPPPPHPKFFGSERCLCLSPRIELKGDLSGILSGVGSLDAILAGASFRTQAVRMTHFSLGHYCGREQKPHEDNPPRFEFSSPRSPLSLSLCFGRISSDRRPKFVYFMMYLSDFLFQLVFN